MMLFGLLLLAASVTSDDVARMIRERTADNPRPLWRQQLPPRLKRINLSPGRLTTDSVIRADFPCNDDTMSGCPQEGPDIAIDASGRFVVAWYEFRDGDADVWFQRFDSAGNRLGSNERINTDITLGWQGDPASAMTPDGKFLFTWEDRRAIGNSDVFAQRFDAWGNRLGNNFRVSDSAVAGDQDISGVYYAPNGTALVAWDDRRNGLTGDIYAQFLNPDGSPRDTNFRVNDDPVGMANQYEPAVRGDDSGRFVVVWMDGRGHNPSDWNIFGQRFSLNGTRLGGNFYVTSDDSIQWSPRLGVGPAGAFVVTWDDRRRGNYDIYAQRYNPAGQPQGDNFRVNGDSGSADQYGSGIAINSAGEFLIVWTDRRNGDEDIYAQRFDSAGNRLGSEFVVNDDNSGTNQAGPAVVARPDGGYWIVWMDGRNGDLDIYGQQLDRNGSPIGANFRINDDQASAQQRVSSIGMNRQGYSCVVWEDERHTGTDIYRAIFDPTGQQLGPNLRLNDDGPAGAAQYYPATAAGKDMFVAAWTDMRAGSSSLDIYGQFLDGSGQPLGPNFRVNSDPGVAYQWYPYCAMDSSDRSVIVWMDTRSGTGWSIYCRRYGPDRNPLGPEFAVGDTDSDQEYASVAANSLGRFVVAWMDGREVTQFHYDIYCQAFREDGSAIGPNIRVNTDSGRTYQSYPACAIDEQGRFVVAWEDTRNQTYNVYLQWFDSTGARLGGNERVNDDLGGTDCYSPTCCFDATGRLAVAFNDDRDAPGNPQIYCQRFRPDRSRISHNQQVNEPNLFPNNHHWTVGQSIAGNEQVLAFAWTDNRRHQGWDIFAKLTDWNLVGQGGPVGTVRGTGYAGPTVIRRGTVITVSCPAGGRVQLFDVTGRVRASGSRLESGRLARGAYFLLVRQGNVRQLQKVVVE